MKADSSLTIHPESVGSPGKEMLHDYSMPCKNGHYDTQFYRMESKKEIVSPELPIEAYSNSKKC
jgi:hypothetical protein